MDEIRLGAILLEGGMVDEAGLERCLAIQSLTGGTRPIGQVLVEQGLVDAQTLARLLDLQKTRHTARRPQVSPAGFGSAALLVAAVANRATELVVSEGRPARIRVGTAWRQLTDDVQSGPEVWDFVRELMGCEVLEQLAEHHFVVRPWRRDGGGAGTVSAFRQFDGVAARVTFAPVEVGNAAAIGVPVQVVDAVLGGRGLVLCVGERGLGRAELLASLAGILAQDPGNYAVVVDDEAIDLPTNGALLVRRRAGLNEADRAAAVRSVVREDPDAMVIADVGSPQVFELALRAAEGGRLVIGYLDAASCVAALARVFNFYRAHELPRVRAALAAVLRVVFVRHLLPDVDHEGTVAATELLVIDEASREVVRGGELTDLGLLLRAEGGRAGYSLDRNMLELLTAGRVRIEDVFARAEEKAWLLERTRDRGHERSIQTR